MTDVRDRLALRLDVTDPDAAVELARRLAPWFGVAKVGIDLLAAAGPGLVGRLRDEGLDVFCDYKLHDIPDQVQASARAVGRLGPRYLTMHAAGGVEMLAAGAAGVAAGATEVGAPAPTALAVTVLTSDADLSPFDARLDAAVESGCGGVVCSAHEAARVKARAPELVVVTPGIRPAAAADDQVRVATPEVAIRNGADVLVIGRPVVAAADPEAAAAAASAEVVSASRR